MYKKVYYFAVRCISLVSSGTLIFIETYVLENSRQKQPYIPPPKVRVKKKHIFCEEYMWNFNDTKQYNIYKYKHNMYFLI